MTDEPTDGWICTPPAGLRRMGVGVPGEVAIAGWDGIVDGQYSSPTLTTVAPDLDVLADWTVDALIRRIEGDRSPGRDVVVPHRLVVRESTTGVEGPSPRG